MKTGHVKAGCVVILWYLLFGRDMMVHNEMARINRQVPSQMQDISNKVANDAVEKYEIVARQGDKTQMYVQAGMCAAAFLQAKDEANYDKWKAIETDSRQGDRASQR